MGLLSKYTDMYLHIFAFVYRNTYIDPLIQQGILGKGLSAIWTIYELFIGNLFIEGIYRAGVLARLPNLFISQAGLWLTLAVV